MSSAATESLVHMVFFTLKDQTDEGRNSFVAACHKYLSDHPGVMHFSAGARASHYTRPVNDRQFDVALVLVFATDEDHVRYQSSERHQQFLAEQAEKWSEVRVFDSWA